MSLARSGRSTEDVRRAEAQTVAHADEHSRIDLTRDGDERVNTTAANGAADINHVLTKSSLVERGQDVSLTPVWADAEMPTKYMADGPSTVRNYVRERRVQIDAEANRHKDAFVPQLHAPGAEAEVDFGDVYVILVGMKRKCHMFAFRLSNSGKAVHRVYSTQGQEAFLEGYIDAFEMTGEIPTRHIRCDNLSSAVTTVIYGAERRRT